MSADETDALPHIYAPVQCSHCYTSLEFEDGYYCPACRIEWGENPFDETPARFIDTDVSPCGAEPDKQPRSGVTSKGMAYAVTPQHCTLPEDHTSKHYFEDRYEFEATK